MSKHKQQVSYEALAAQVALMEELALQANTNAQQRTVAKALRDCDWKPSRYATERPKRRVIKFTGIKEAFDTMLTIEVASGAIDGVHANRLRDQLIEAKIPAVPKAKRPVIQWEPLAPIEYTRIKRIDTNSYLNVETGMELTLEQVRSLEHPHYV